MNENQIRLDEVNEFEKYLDAHGIGIDHPDMPVRRYVASRKKLLSPPPAKTAAPAPAAGVPAPAVDTSNWRKNRRRQAA